MSGRAGRVLAIDPGRVRFGLAVSDPSRTISQGLPTLASGGRRKDLEALTALVREQGVAEIVVGCPRNLDGSDGALTEFAKRLARELQESTGIPVATWDERLTSAEAERVLVGGNVSRQERKLLTDRLAAVLILEGFLQSRQAQDPM